MRTPIEIAKAGAKVIISGVYSLLDTNFGLQVKFDGVHHLEITVPGEYFDKVRSAVLLLPLCSFFPPFYYFEVRQSKTMFIPICTYWYSDISKI